LAGTVFTRDQVLRHVLAQHDLVPDEMTEDAYGPARSPSVSATRALVTVGAYGESASVGRGWARDQALPRH